MKFAISQTALPTSNTTFDFTDSGISSDWKGSIFFWSDATTNDTQGGTAKLFIGATDGTRNVAAIGSVADAASGARSSCYLSNTNCIARIIAGSGTVNVLGAYDSTLSNGVRLALSANDATAHLVNALHFAGSDIEFAVSSVSFGTSDTTKTVTHNLTGTPDCVLMISGNGVATFASVNNCAFTIGMYAGSDLAGVGFNHTINSNPTAVAAIATTDLGHSILANADHATFSLSSVGGTTFDCNRTAADGDAACVIFIAWRATSGTPVKKVSLVDSATSTGDQAILTGMGGAPSLVLAVQTRLTSTSLATNDSAGSIGFGAAVNNAGTTQQGNVAVVTKDNVATSVAKSYVSLAQFIQIADTSVALVGKATLDSFDSGGATVNWSVAAGTAYKMAVLGYGAASVGGAGLSQLHNQGGF